ncbi:MAG TPA: hypothetical protein VHX60_01045 [Acidobacteriaceae bacterium]|jgi:hypothetical protein|nr:hypothetical protein [Acidobacteriaceae bacterium]
MSGYLQRLASAATHPARAIHPVVRSVFAPPVRQPAMDSPEEFSVEAWTREPADRASHGETHFEAPLVKAPSELEHIAPHMQTGSRSATPIDPVAPAQSRRAPSRTAEPAGPEARSGGDADRDQTQSSEPRRMSSPESSSDADDFHPLVRVAPPVWQSTPESPLSREVRDLRNAAASQGNRNPGNPRQTATAPAQREPDEIQIHIGRIEVTAVPPPAAQRPTPRDQHKSVSLDDYLRRRNGRNG